MNEYLLLKKKYSTSYGIDFNWFIIQEWMNEWMFFVKEETLVKAHID